MVLSKRPRSKLLSPGIQIALPQQGLGITCKLCASTVYHLRSRQRNLRSHWIVAHEGCGTGEFLFANRYMGMLQISDFILKHANCRRGWDTVSGEAECRLWTLGLPYGCEDSRKRILQPQSRIGGSAWIELQNGSKDRWNWAKICSSERQTRTGINVYS